MVDIENIINYSNSIFWNSNFIVMAAYVASLTYLFTVRDKQDKAKKLFAMFSLLALIIFCYNPLIYKMLSEQSLDSDDGVFARIWIILPIWLVIAFAFTAYISKGRSLSIQNRRFICAVLLIALSGASFISNDYYCESKSAYKVNSLGIELADKILDHTDGNCTDVLLFLNTGANNNYISGEELENTFLQYTGKIGVTPYYYNEQTIEECFYNDTLPDGITQTADYMNEVFTWLRNHYGFSYIVIPHEESLPVKMQYCGYEYIDSSGNYDIYQATSKWFVQSYSYAMENSKKMYVLSDNMGNCVVIGGGAKADRKAMQSILSIYGRHVDAWIITCPSADYLEGFNKIVSTEGFTVGTVYMPSVNTESLLLSDSDASSYEEFLSLADENKFKLCELKANDELELFGMDFLIMSDLLDVQSGSLVDNSMLLKVTIGNKSILFCSYIGYEQGQAALSKYGNELQSDYVQIASGYGEGLGQQFYETVDPEIAFCDSISDNSGRQTYNLLTELGVTCYCLEYGTMNMVIIE